MALCLMITKESEMRLQLTHFFSPAVPLWKLNPNAAQSKLNYDWNFKQHIQFAIINFHLYLSDWLKDQKAFSCSQMCSFLWQIITDIIVSSRMIIYNCIVTWNLLASIFSKVCTFLEYFVTQHNVTVANSILRK